MALTEKQKRFADEYLIDLNATRAYRAAYSSCKKDEVAAVNGSKLLRNTKVEKYINAELEKIQSAKIQEEVVVVEGTGEGCSDARIIKKQISEKDRIKAAELLGKRYSLFTDKMDVSGVEGVVIVNDIPKPD